MKQINFKNKSFLIIAVYFFLVIFSFPSICFADSSAEQLEREPIDVVMTYVDLTDPKLQKDRKSRIKKEEDNDELKYSVRSILKNIPWIRKIHIITPNDKVKYFKDKDLISDKISYIKDEDLLGFKSSSSITIEFNLWKLKKFGVTNNFIYMNDDFFIGKSIKKSDFFYVNNNKVVPYVIYNLGLNNNKYDTINDEYKHYKKIVAHQNAHLASSFHYQRMSSFMLLYKILGKNIFVPSESLWHCPHNALGENLDELKETYDAVKNNYEYADSCLNAEKRNNKALQHQTFYSFYMLNKHKRKVKKLKISYTDFISVAYANFNVPLFCINTSANINYSDDNYAYAKIVMERLFPKPTPYEKVEINNGTYVIESALEKGKVWDIDSASNENGANLRLWKANGTDAQKFSIRVQSDGTYTIEPLCSHKRIDVWGAGKSCGTNIWQYEKNGSSAQKWYLVPVGKGYFYINPACNNLCADVDSANSKSGTNIRCWDPNGSKAQKFKFIKVK